LTNDQKSIAETYDKTNLWVSRNLHLRLLCYFAPLKVIIRVDLGTSIQVSFAKLLHVKKRKDFFDE